MVAPVAIRRDIEAGELRHRRDTRLSRRLFTDLDHIIEVCCTTWNTLIKQPGRIRSTCAYPWAAPVNIS
jgi:hypothetical protein